MSNSKVLDRVIYECREAYLSKQPLIFIKTEEKEFVFSVIKESNLVTPGTQNSFSGFPTGFYNFLKDASREKWFDFIQTESSKLKIESNIPFAFMICLPDENLRIIKDKYRHEALSEYVWRYINETNSQSSLSKNLVILYGDPAFLPSDLIPYTAVIEVGFPEKQEIKEIIKEDYKCCTGRDPDEDLVNTYADEMSGLGIMDVHRRMNLLLGNTASDHRTLFETKNESKKALRRAKEIVLKLNGNILTLMEKDEEAELGGLEQYSKYWTSDNGGNLNHLKDPDRYLLERGVPPLKGVLLCGIPGCGKSAAVKILQRDSGLPVLRMSIDQLMGQYVGNSEENMRIALSQAEAMAPCILFVDEIEKGFKGAGGSDKGSDTFMRMFGRFLTWMQDRKKPVFIFATANDISSLPPEFFRSGRFDESFGLFMPTEKECKSIFKAQMKIREKKWCKARSVDNNEVKLFDGECFDDKCLSEIMAYFTQGKDIKNSAGKVKFVTGADIEKIVSSSLKRNNEIPIKAENWLKSVREVINDPMIITQGSTITGLDNIAACTVRLLRGNFIPSSEGQIFSAEKVHNIDNKMKITDMEPDGDYDKAMYFALKERVECMWDKISKIDLEKATGER